MNRPLETTFWMRFKQFMKGAFLYNTIYWRRASDDLNIQRMSREERASLRPKRDLEIIRPRERPRPPTSGAVLSLPPEQGGPPTSFPGAQVSEPTRDAEVSSRPVLSASAEDENVEIHRRKKRRRSRHSKVMPKRYYDSSGGGSGSGMLGWLFKK